MGSRYYLLQRQCFQWQEFTGFLLFLKVKAETQEYLVRKIHRQKQIKVTTRNSLKNKMGIILTQVSRAISLKSEKISTPS